MSGLPTRALLFPAGATLPANAKTYFAQLYDFMAQRFAPGTAGVAAATTAEINATADALGAFRRGTLLGTVSQTAGAPTGAVIERGTNANGEYTRWADGTQICFANILATSNVNNAVGSIFTTASVGWTFPTAFVGTPVTSVNESGGVGGCWGSLGGLATSATATSFQIKSAVSVATAPTASLTAVGRWF